MKTVRCNVIAKTVGDLLMGAPYAEIAIAEHEAAILDSEREVF